MYKQKLSELNAFENKILNELYENKEASVEEIAKKINEPEPKVRWTLQLLIDRGLVEAVETVTRVRSVL
jgi:DNA-binding Lrp family transcriptional regulator